MKKLFTFLIISLFTTGIIFANPVDKTQAKKVATNYFKHYAPNSINNFAIKNSFTEVSEGKPTYYVFNFTSGGFVMVSADDAVTPVLGYSFTSEFKEEGKNPAAEAMFKSFSKNIQHIIEEKTDNNKSRPEWNRILNNEFTNKSKSVDPLLTTTWNQSGGFDAYVPAGTPVGCVATAMAQVMNYHEHPVSGVKWHSYNHPDYGSQMASFATTTYDWDNMPNSSASDASAILSYHCGVAIDMNYGPGGSGAQTADAANALASYFKYDQGIQMIYQAAYTIEEWENILKENLDAQMPVIYSGRDGEGEGSNGHAFVCDGYNDDDNFHINWGWGGYLDGFYAIGAFPSGAPYNYLCGAVINIQPAPEGEEDMLWIKKWANFTSPYSSPSYIDVVDENIAWTVGSDGSGGNVYIKSFAKTASAGTSWLAGHIEEFGTEFSMIDGIDENTAFIACFGTGSDNHILKTTDGGNSWESILQGAGSASFFNIVHFFNDNDGFVQGDPEGGEYELYTTTDGGQNWTRVDGANIPDPSSSLEYGIVGHFDAVGDNIWYTTNKGQVYKSTDKGYTWSKYTMIEDITSESTYIEITFSDNATTGLALATVVSSSNSFIRTERLVSNDGGETWEEIAHTGNFYDNDVCFVPGNESMVISTGYNGQTSTSGVSYSTDAGNTWTDYAGYYQGLNFGTLAVYNENKAYAGAFIGATYSGAVWTLGGFASAAPNFVVDQNEICQNGEVNFTNESIGEYDNIVWDFGEGAEPETSTDESVDVTYTTAGEKTVTITIYSDGIPVTESKINYIMVYGIPEVGFNFTQLSETSAAFESTSAPVYPGTTVYIWDIGDNHLEGTNFDVLSPYNNISVGEYEVTLTVQNYANCEDSYTQTITMVGINEAGFENLSIYPNPAKDVLNVANAKDATISIITLDGKVLQTITDAANNVSFDLSNLAKGVYAVRITREKATTTKLFTVQ